MCWIGDIYGFMLFFNYECEFVSICIGEVIFLISVRIIQVKSKDFEVVFKIIGN